MSSNPSICGLPRAASSLDKITEDGILSMIKSSLSPREAVRTCVLSRRWRTISTNYTKINFSATNMLGVDAGKLCRTLEFTGQVAAVITERFITSVNAVLKGQHGAGLEEFMIQFYFQKSHSHHLDAWLGYGVGSKTKKLVLDLSPQCLSYLLHKIVTEPEFDFPFEVLEPELYDFPCHLLGSSCIENLELMSCSLNPPHRFNGLHCLKSLKLARVDVTEEDIRCLLFSCYTLESLEVCSSRKLITLSTSHPLTRLKYLSVFSCDELRKIEIDAKNLTRLSYWGDPVDFLLEKSSQLNSAWIFLKIDDGGFPLDKLSESLPNLENLTFAIIDTSQDTINFPVMSNVFIHLRRLEWTVPSKLHSKKGCLCLAYILTVAPFLKKLSLLCASHRQCLRELKKLKRMGPSPHTHLRTVEFAGFTGDKWQIKLAVYILDCAVGLESMTLHKADVDCERDHKPSKDDGYWGPECYKNFKTNMESLVREVPATVNLVTV